jgi:uncharacterized membrane protein
MAEQQMAHRHQLEAQVIGSDVNSAYGGLVAGFVLGLVSICAGVWAIVNGHDWAGATVATGVVVGLVSVFVYGTRSRRQERQHKAQMLPRLPEPKEKQEPPKGPSLA